MNKYIIHSVIFLQSFGISCIVKMTSVVQGLVAYFVFCIDLAMFNNVSGNVLFANN